MDEARARRARAGAEASVLIAAAGVGARLGARTPKQFLALAGVPIVVATVAVFRRHPRVAAIVVAAPATHVARARRLLGGRSGAPVAVVAGGATRQDSVWCALQAAPDAPVTLVHDAVRPFVRPTLIDAVIDAALAHGAAICALPVAETVKRVRGGLVEATVERDGLWMVQTPQAFRTAVLREAHDKARRDGFTGTDEAMLVERLGLPVRVVPGLPDNVKITTVADLRRARHRPR